MYRFWRCLIWKERLPFPLQTVPMCLWWGESKRCPFNFYCLYLLSYTLLRVHSVERECAFNLAKLISVRFWLTFTTSVQLSSLNQVWTCLAFSASQWKRIFLDHRGYEIRPLLCEMKNACWFETGWLFHFRLIEVILASNWLKLKFWRQKAILTELQQCHSFIFRINYMVLTDFWVLP